MGENPRSASLAYVIWEIEQDCANFVLGSKWSKALTFLKKYQKLTEGSAPSLAVNDEVNRLRLQIAKAALCIMENPYKAINDTLWLSEKGLAPTLFEHLVGELDCEMDGTHEDQVAALRKYIATRTPPTPAPVAEGPGLEELLAALTDGIKFAELCKLPDGGWKFRAYKERLEPHAYGEGITPTAAVQSALAQEGE